MKFCWMTINAVRLKRIGDNDQCRGQYLGVARTKALASLVLCFCQRPAEIVGMAVAEVKGRDLDRPAALGNQPFGFL